MKAPHLHALQLRSRSRITKSTIQTSIFIFSATLIGCAHTESSKNKEKVASPNYQTTADEFRSKHPQFNDIFFQDHTKK